MLLTAQNMCRVERFIIYETSISQSYSRFDNIIENVKFLLFLQVLPYTLIQDKFTTLNNNYMSEQVKVGFATSAAEGKKDIRVVTRQVMQYIFVAQVFILS